MEVGLRREAASQSEWQIEPLLGTALPPWIISPSLFSAPFSSSICQCKSLSFFSFSSGFSFSQPHLQLLDSSVVLCCLTLFPLAVCSLNSSSFHLPAASHWMNRKPTFLLFSLLTFFVSTEFYFLLCLSSAFFSSILHYISLSIVLSQPVKLFSCLIVINVSH